MHTRAVSLAVVAGLAAGLGGVGVGGVQAQTRTWRTPTNGTFSVGSNWVGGVAPGSGNAAAFGLTSSTTPFTVSFAADAGTAGLTVSNQRPTFSLGGFTYNVTGDTLIGGSNGPVLTVTGGTLNTCVGFGQLFLSQNAAQSGTLAVNGGTATVQGTLTTMGGGRGDVVLSNGGQLTVAGDVSAWGAGTRQNWSIAGAGSQLTANGTFRVGNEGSAFTMQVSGGGMADLDYLPLVGGNSAGQASITVSGTGSSLDCRYVQSEQGATTLTVIDGGAVSMSDQLRLGCCYVAGSSTVLVRGAESRLRVGNELLVGFETGGTHTLTIDQGAALIGDEEGQNLYAWIGHRGRGILRVDGAGSEIRLKNRLHVGWPDANSNGTLTVSNGASATLGSLWMSAGQGGTETATVEGGAFVSTAEWVDVGEASTLTVRAGSGIEAAGGFGIRGWQSRAAEIVVGADSYIFATSRIDLGHNAPVVGASILTLDGGTAYTLDYMPVNDTGIVRGVGSIEGGVSVNGVVQPGLPIGTLNVTGIGFTDHRGRLEIQIGGAAESQYDRLAVANNAFLNGTLALSIANGFSPSIGQTFDILTVGGSVVGEFDTVTGSDLGPGKAFLVQYLPNTVRLVAEGVTGFDVSEPTLRVVEGFTEAVAATATFSNATSLDVSSAATWSSDDTSVAVVAPDGRITGVHGGTTTIRSAYAGLHDSVQVTVRDLPRLQDANPGLVGTMRDTGLLEFDALAPFLTTTKSSIQFDGGEANVLSGRSTWYGARFTGRIVVPTTGDYTFVAGADDVVSVWIDGAPITFGKVYWAEQPGTLTLTAGEHDIRVDYAQNSDPGSWMGVDWSGPGLSRRRITSQYLAGGQATLEFFDAPQYPFADAVPDLDQFRIVESATYADINRDLYPNGYTGFRMLRYVGDVAIPDAGEYTFTVNVDDGAKVWFGETLVLDAWSPWAFGLDHTFTMSLDRGVFPIRVDCTEHQGHYGGIVMSLEGPGISKQPIPAAAFTFGGTPDSGCAADFNGDGFLDFFDYDDYVGCFETGVCPPGTTADFNGDGFADFFDYDDFVLAFETGC